MDLGQKMFGRIYWWTGGRWLKGDKLQLKAGIHLLLRETILLVSGIIFNFFILFSLITHLLIPISINDV